MPWIEGSVYDRYIVDNALIGIISSEVNGRWFWHTYYPEAQGYTDTKENAMKLVEGNSNGK